ncbi:hypothetical protein [Bacillus cereus]
MFFLDNLDLLAPLIAGITAGVLAANIAFKAMMIIRSVAIAVQLLSAMLGLNTIATAAGTTAQWALNGAMYANPIGIVIGLIVALIAVGVLLYQNWDEITKWCKEMWAVLEEKWDQGVTILKAAYRKMVFEAKKWWAETQEWWDKTVQDAKDKAEEMKQKVVQKYEWLKQEAVKQVLQLYYDTRDKWNQMKQDAQDKVEEMKQKAIQKYEQMKQEAVQKLLGMVSDVREKFNDMVNTARGKASDMGDAARNMMNAFTDSVKNGFNSAVNAVSNGVSNMFNSIGRWWNTFYQSGKGLLGSFVNGITSGFGDAVSAVSRGMSNIRAYLPFSPAKKGPLSDLDKSGEAFFPTWYEAALTQVSTMERSIGGAFSGVADTASVALASTGLEAFTGGRTSVTVNHVVKVDGTVGFDSKGIEEFEDRVTQQVVNTSGGGYGGIDYSGLQQSIRKY